MHSYPAIILSTFALLFQRHVATPLPSRGLEEVLPIEYAGLGDGLNFNATFGPSPQPFTVAVDPDFVETTKFKASLYRPSRDIKDEDWLDGPPEHNMTAVSKYWAKNYSWADVQSGINEKYSQYTTTVQSGPNFTYPVPLHFVHHRSSRSDAIPLLMLHGWPSSFLEWDKVIGPLTSPPSSSLPAFDVVAPDLPGHGFSPAPQNPGLGPREIGQAFDDLMHQLGYTRYSIYTTDLGTFVGNWMVYDLSSSVVSHLTDFGYAPPNATDLQRYAANQTTAEENAFIEEYNNIFSTNTVHLQVHSEKPLAIAVITTDSPVGFVGWTWQLRHACSDGYDYTPQELITDAMLLYIQGTYNNIRAYKEFFREDESNYPPSNVPTGVTLWPSLFNNSPVPFSNTPLSWLQRKANVTFYDNDHLGDAGGHFPAEASPQAWLESTWKFFGDPSISGLERL